MDGVFNFPVWTFSFYINSKIIQLLKTTDMNTFILSKGFQVSFVCVFFFTKYILKQCFPNLLLEAHQTVHILDVSLILPIYFWSWSLY